MRRVIAALVTVGAVGVLAACTDAERPGTAPAEAASGAASGTGIAPSAIRIVAERDANVRLWVSNQSFDDDPVTIGITIDGVELVARPFYVESQHNWTLVPIEAPAGRHIIHVVSDTGAELLESFMLPDAGRRYALVDSWYYPGNGGRHFTWSMRTTPIGFD